jgi:hypothetical protein
MQYYDNFMFKIIYIMCIYHIKPVQVHIMLKKMSKFCTLRTKIKRIFFVRTKTSDLFYREEN